MGSAVRDKNGALIGIAMAKRAMRSTQTVNKRQIAATKAQRLPSFQSTGLPIARIRDFLKLVEPAVGKVIVPSVISRPLRMRSRYLRRGCFARRALPVPSDKTGAG